AIKGLQFVIIVGARSTFFIFSKIIVMKRRDFITTSSIAATALIAVPAKAVIGSEKTQESIPPGFTDDFELNEITVTELQEKIKSGTYTAEMLTEMYLQRIAAIDKSGPNINAVIEQNPDALNIAQALDKERKEGKIRGPLHGIPVLIKDNIDTAD